MADLPSALKILGEALILASAKMALDSQERSGALSPAQPQDEAWLTPLEASRRLQVTVRWLSRRWRRLPFCHQLPAGARGYRVNARELEQEMARRR
jgi:hypothetical protein